MTHEKGSNGAGEASGAADAHGRPGKPASGPVPAREGRQRVIARLVGGLVESYPHGAEVTRTSGSLLRNGAIQMFTRAGFSPAHRRGKNHWVVTRTIDSAG